VELVEQNDFILSTLYRFKSYKELQLQLQFFVVYYKCYKVKSTICFRYCGLPNNPENLKLRNVIIIGWLVTCSLKNYSPIG
jgi:hypothetical protein